MIIIALCFFTFIRNEITTGFVIEDNEQLLELKLDQSFVEIKRSFLLEKSKKNGEFFQVKTMNKKTRCIQNEEEFINYEKEKNLKRQKEEEMEEKGMSDEDVEPDREFDELFVDISGLKKTEGKVFGISVECYKKNGREFLIYSRPFTWNDEDGQWVLGDLPIEDSYSSYWKYAGIAVACVVFIGFCAYFLS